MSVKCSVYIATSVDGFIARIDGGIDWLTSGEPAPAGEDYGYKEFFDSVDTLIIGRMSFEKVLTFGEWPYAGKRVVVLSSGTPEIPKALKDDVRIMSGSPTAIVQELEEQETRHVYVDGGVAIQGFLRAGLIDEMTITRIPVLIGEGIPLFGALPGDIRLRHIGTRAYSNGLVQTRYEVRKVGQPE